MCSFGAGQNTVNFGLYPKPVVPVVKEDLALNATSVPTDAENNLRQVLRESKMRHAASLADVVGIYPC